MRRAALQLLNQGVGVLGLNRTCSGASTSGLLPEAGCVVCATPARRLLAVLSEARSSSSAAGRQAPVLHHHHGALLAIVGAAQPAALTVDASAAAYRGYKSNKRSLKPLNTKASWEAAKPFLEQADASSPAPADGQQPGGGRLRPGPRSRPPPTLGPIIDTCLPDIPVVQLPTEYKRVGAITGRYMLKPERVFAVVELAGTQFKVTTDDIIFVNQLKGVEVNDVLALDRVLLLGSRAQTVVGRPYVPGTTILAAVEEHFRDGKVHVFKKKAKKRYRKYQGPRPNLTTLRILKVLGIEPAQGDELALPPVLPMDVDRRYEALLEGLNSGAGSDDDQRRLALA